MAGPARRDTIALARELASPTRPAMMADPRSTDPTPTSSPAIRVEPWPSGGWAVWLTGHPTPISRHDTEEEAYLRAARYRRGIQLDEADPEASTQLTGPGYENSEP